MKSSVQFSPSKHWENISRMFKKLYNDDSLADITLCCKDGTIKAHKLILATSSPYFHKIFTENNRTNRDQHFILIMHGISFQTLHDLIELIYKGNVEVLPERLNRLYELAGELQLSGVLGTLREEASNSSSEQHRRNSSEISGHGRDTRFRGLKRVAVDFKDIEEQSLSSVKRLMQEQQCKEDDPNESKSSHCSEPSVSVAVEQNKPNSLLVNTEVSPIPGEPPKLSAWAKKQRKFKCDLCPSSFKRSSHLTRHQLVHTGERPFACDQCDKAFSRHDKLKHHIRKAHEIDYENEFSVELANIATPSSTSTPTAAPAPPVCPSPPPFIISNVRTESEAEDAALLAADSSANGLQKRPRGRPRKYPVVEKPTVKRGRGRPRLNPVKPNEVNNGENYDITNLPYGDLEYLTMPLQEPVLIEPLVEIKTEKEESVAATGGSSEDQNNEQSVQLKKIVTGEETHAVEDDFSTESVHLKVLEKKITKIGECTISVATHSS